MRVSCVSFARFQSSDGRYILLINEGRLKRDGRRTLTPIGGGLEVGKAGIHILRGMGAHSFEAPNELRFHLPEDRLDRVRRWFATQKGRECSVLREVAEELVRETLTITAAMFGHVTQRYHGSTEHWNPVKETHYLIDVFNVRTSPKVLQVIERASQLPVEQRWVYFVSEEDIRAGYAPDGTEINPLCTSIL